MKKTKTYHFKSKSNPKKTVCGRYISSSTVYHDNLEWVDCLKCLKKLGEHNGNNESGD